MLLALVDIHNLPFRLWAKQFSQWDRYSQAMWTRVPHAVGDLGTHVGLWVMELPWWDQVPILGMQMFQAPKLGMQMLQLPV